MCIGDIIMSFGKKSRNLLLAVLFIAFIALVGCSSDEADTEEKADKDEEVATTGGELNIAYSAQPPVLDPQVDAAIVTAEIMGHVFETLLTTDSNYNIEPMLAESYEQSDDGLTITFNLREDVLFHNGEQMVGEDVAASMNRWKEGPGGRGQFGEANFEATDEHTVVLTLAEPLSTVLNSIAQGGSSFAAIMPKAVIEDAEPTTVNEVIGTGPFEFVEWKQDQNIHLTKFADYAARTEESDGLAGKKEALVDDIYFQFVTDPSTRVAGIQSGEYDIAIEIPYDNAEQLKSDPSLEVRSIPGAGTLLMFTNKKKGLFTDVKAREALSTVLNIDDILTAAFTDEEYYTTNHSMMMPHQEDLWYSENGKDKYNLNDPEKAKALFEEAGYDGEEITIMTSRDYEYLYNASVVLQSQLEAIGMDVKLDVYDWATLIDKMTDEDAYDINMIWIGYKPDPTSHHFLNTEISGWTDSDELAELLAEFRSQPTIEDAMPIYDDLQEWFWDYQPASKIGDYNRIDAIRDTVDNYEYSDRMILWNVTNSK